MTALGKGHHLKDKKGASNLPLSLLIPEQLHSLNISGNKLGDDSLAGLCRMKNLLTLRIDDNRISSLYAFPEMPSLQALYLSQNRVSLPAGKAPSYGPSKGKGGMSKRLGRRSNKLEAGFPQLDVLDLSNNRIESLER